MRPAVLRDAMKGKRWLWAALAAGIALLAIGVTLWLVGRPAEKPTAQFVEVAEGVYILPKPDSIAKFALVSHDNAVFDNRALEGKWSFLFFGFTHCPDLCPTTLAVFQQVYRRLGEAPGNLADVQFVFVSVDPERDTPQVLKEYVGHVNLAFIGVTGGGPGLAQLADSLGVVYAKVPGTTAEQYFMDHSSAVLLTDPDGRFHGVFAAPHAAQRIVDGYREIRKRSG
jgi:protein SCO1/2